MCLCLLLYVSTNYNRAHRSLQSFQLLDYLLLYLDHCILVTGLEKWARGSTSAMSLDVRRLSGKHRSSELMLGCTLARGPLSAAGFSAGNVSHAVTSCNDTPGHTQVCLLEHSSTIGDFY